VSESETRPRTVQSELPTEVFDWGSIKWGVSADLFSGAPTYRG
jgi:hypothetical protein